MVFARKLPFLFSFVLLFAISAFAQEPVGVPPLRVVYFTPSDCSPPPQRPERLGRVMKQIQSFFQGEMERNGFGPMTFALEWTSPGRLKLYEVSGKKTIKNYGRHSGWDVYEETRRFLATRDLDIDKEFVLMLTPLILWNEDGTATEWGPYAGGGTTASGFAWAFDDALLDSELLSSKEPGGYFFAPCSLGVFNTKYIGGIAHELGHCFGLPHECESAKEKKTRGTSLMGGGNHTYGEELRNEGLGTFLSGSAALRLSVCRAFSRDYRTARAGSSWKMKKLQGKAVDGKIVLEGRGDSGEPPIGIIAYHDDGSNSHDYDSTSWTGVPDAKGNFRVVIDDLARVPYTLRLVSVFRSGAIREISTRHMTTPEGPDLKPINTLLSRTEIKEAFRENDLERVAKILRTIVRENPDNEEWKRKFRHFFALKKNRPPVFPDKAISGIKQIDLSLAKTLKEEVGWHSPARRRVPEDGFIEVDHMFFESGLYAHAPSAYEFSLEKKWKDLKFATGLQDGHPGSVVFVVRGDGQELFRSKTIKSNEIHRNRVDVSKVEKLELITEDAGDGTSHDWGIWIEPQLVR